MEATELIKKVRKIEIKSKGLSNQIFSGEYFSAFKGRGMTFSEVREYQFGDEIRTIDWNVTARFNHPYVKVFQEEREMSVMLMIDISASSLFGTKVLSKKELITEIAATIAFSAIQNNDKIGVIFFTDKIEKFIPPKKGKSHILRIIRELLLIEPQQTKTDIAQALRYLTNVQKRRTTTFIISDFIDDQFNDEIKLANKRHPLYAIKINDIAEHQLPRVGLLKVKDLETGKSAWVDTNDKNVQEFLLKQSKLRDISAKDSFRKSGVDFADIYTGQSYIKPLVNLFKKQSSKV